MAVTAAGTPYVELSDNVANYPGVSLALANHIDATAGKVLQVVSVTKTDTFSSAVNSTWTDITDLSVSITPSATSSKVMVTFSVCGVFYVSGVNVGALRVTRNGTVALQGDAASSRTQVLTSQQTILPDGISTVTYTFVDSPASVASLTYSLQFFQTSAGMRINRNTADDNAADVLRGASTITVMEIGA